jgi:hypothetical protein
MILLIPIFIGCASKIKIDELSIEGEVYDEDTNEGLENVRVEIKGYGWTCNEKTKEDGDYYVSVDDSYDTCIPLKRQLNTIDLKKNPEIELSIGFDLKGYKPQEINLLKWNLKDDTFIPPEIYLVEAIIDRPCPSYKYPCTKHPSGCCTDCPVGTFWKIENGEEMCKDVPPRGVDPVVVRSKYINIKLFSQQVDEISFEIDGKSQDELEEMGLDVWDEENNYIRLLRMSVAIQLDINYRIGESSETQSINLDPESIADRKDLELRWNSSKKKFIASWETK